MATDQSIKSMIIQHLYAYAKYAHYNTRQAHIDMKEKNAQYYASFTKRTIHMY